MKEFLLDTMLAMMPAMQSMTYIGLGLVVLSIVSLLLIKITGKKLTISVSLLAVLLGVFFLIAHPMGVFLGMNPSINFGNAEEFEFILYPFWQIGLIIFVPSFLVFMIAKRLRTKVVY